MPSVEQSKFFFNFTGGLNTDATVMNFPENAWVEGDNMDLFRTGEVKRRLGAEFENGYQLSDADIAVSTATQSAMSMHEWLAVNGRGDLNFLVVQMGSILYIHDLGREPVSDSVLGTVDIEPFAQGSGIPGDTVVDTSYGEGVMIVCNQNMDPIRVEYNEDTGLFNVFLIEVKIRDFEGLEDNLGVGERPTALSVNHEYNLSNQGWADDVSITGSRSGSSGVVIGPPIAGTFSVIGLYPSNADIVFASKIPSVQAGKEEVLGAYSPGHLADHSFGNSPAAKGHYIFNAFNLDRGGVSGVTGLTPETITVRPTNTAFWAGRVWYAGVPDPRATGDVYFSQSLTQVENAGKCYQDADPTAEDINSLVATDGGVIHIADMGHVYRTEEVGQDLMLFAANGVWAISGTLGGNFTADDFTVRKVTDIGTTSSDSVIEADGVVFYWSQGGIYMISSGQIDDVLSVSRISKDTVQGLFDEIGAAARAYSRGWFDQFENRVYWFWNDSESYDGIDFRFSYNRVLALDLTLQSFFTYTIEDLPTNSPFIAGMTQKEAGSEDIISYDVVEGLGSSRDDVVEGGDDVIADIAFPVFTNTNLKLLTVVLDLNGFYEYTFSEFRNRDFKEWTTWDQVANDASNTGVDFSSFVQPAWQSSGDTIRDRIITHVTSYFNRTETGYELDGEGEIVFADPSGCTVQTRWEWTDSENAGRWTTPVQAYKYKRFFLPEDVDDPLDYSFQVIQSKHRMRGRGHSLSLRYESDPGEDTQLLGFAINIRAVSKV